MFVVYFLDSRETLKMPKCFQKCFKSVFFFDFDKSFAAGMCSWTPRASNNKDQERIELTRHAGRVHVEIRHEVPGAVPDVQAQGRDMELTVGAAVTPLPNHVRHVVEAADGTGVRDTGTAGHTTQQGFLYLNHLPKLTAPVELIQEAQLHSGSLYGLSCGKSSSYKIVAPARCQFRYFVPAGEAKETFAWFGVSFCFP